MLLAPDLILVGPGATLVGLGTALTVLSFVQPAGVEIGSLRWQPVFFSGIALVLGVQALLAGAVLAHYSSVTAPGIQRRFAFVTRLTFANRCVALGMLLVAAGLAIHFALFVVWVSDAPPPRGFSYASLAQSLVLVGSSIASFGAISRFQRARAARRLDGSQPGRVLESSRSLQDPQVRR